MCVCVSVGDKENRVEFVEIRSFEVKTKSIDKFSFSHFLVHSRVILWKLKFAYCFIIISQSALSEDDNQVDAGQSFKR